LGDAQGTFFLSWLIGYSTFHLSYAHDMQRAGLSRAQEPIYRPDLLVKDPNTGDIEWIVEVETSEPGKQF
jgi:hypothetical protein